MAEGQNVRQWLDDLCRGSRRWIQGTIAAGILAAMATVAQMVFLARIVHLGVIGQAPVQTLSPLFLGLAVSIIVRTGAQGLQTRLAARCSEQVRRDARRQLHHHWQSLGPVELGKHSAGTLAREWNDHVEALHGYFARILPQMALATLTAVQPPGRFG